MNTKTIRLLSVLAVLAMAFAAFGIVTQAEANDAVGEIDVSKETATLLIDPTEVTDSAITTLYFSESGIVKIKANMANLTVYVNNGNTVELKFTSAAAAEVALTITTVAGDRTDKKAFNDTKIVTTVGKNATFEYTAATITSSGSLSSNPYTYAKFYYSGTLTMTSAGARTAIAAGEELVFIAAQDFTNCNFAYGVKYKLTDGYHVTAPGEKVSDVLTASADAITISKATVTVKATGTNPATATFTGFAGEPVTVVLDGEKMKITGAVPAYAKLTLSGTVILDMGHASATKNFGEIVINKDAAVTIAGTNTLISEGTIVLNSETPVMNSAGTPVAGITNKGVVKVNEAALWDPTAAEADKTVKGIAAGSTGLIDTSGATAVAELQLDVVSLLIYPKQTYVVTKDTRVTGDLTVSGRLIINEGITLTIEENAKMVLTDSIYAEVINNGTIIIKVAPTTAEDTQATNHGLTIGANSTFVNNGVIQTSSSASLSSTVDNAAALTVSSANFTNNGTLTIGPSDVATATAGTFGGNVTVSGQFSGTAKVTGALSLNSAKLKDSLTVDLASKNAKFSIVQVEILKGTEAGTEAQFGITVSNTSMKTSSGETDGAATVTILPDASIAQNKVVYFGSLEFVASEYKSGTWKKQLVTSGMISANTNDTNINLNNIITATATGGRVTVTDSLTLPSKATMTVAKMAVSGTVFATTGSTLTITALESVTGEISGSQITITEAGSNYAKYYANTAVGYVYTSLPKAIVGVGETTNKIVIINGSLTLSEDLTIPTGYTVAGSGTLSIGTSSNASPVLTLQTNASYAAGTVSCYGTFFAETSNNLSSTVNADVKIQDGNSVTYTNFANAVSIGKAMTLLTGPATTGIVVSSDLAIPAGVVIDNSNATNGITVKGAQLSVEGTYLIPGALLTVQDSYVSEASVTVGGFLKFKLADNDDKWWYPAGVHYSETIDDVQYYTTTSVANIAQAVMDTDDDEISITADEIIPDVTIVAPGEDPITLKISGENVKTGVMTIDNIVVEYGTIDTLTTTVKNGDGEISIVNARPVSLKIVEDGNLTMSGALFDPEASAVTTQDEDTNKYYKTYSETYAVTFTGETYITKFTANMWDGNYDGNGQSADAAYRLYDSASGIESPAIIVVGTLTAEGRSNTFYSIVTVAGEMVADNSARITFENEVYVLGNLVAKEKASDAAAGAIFLEKDAYIGATKYDLFNKKLMNAQAGTGVLSGDVSLASGSVIFETDGSSVAYEIVEDLSFAVLQVEGETFLTIYKNITSSTSTVDVSGLMFPIESGKVVKFVDENGDEIAAIEIDPANAADTAFSNEYRAFTAGSIAVSAEGKVYNAISEFDIYNVVIKTDNSIKAVYIDGALMTTSYSANYFEKEDVTIGKHTITVEPVTGYSADKCYLYLDNGTKLTGMTFIFDESDCKKVVDNEGNISYYIIYNVAGTEEIVPEPAPVEKEEWTITTILLVILVILIAIMAVIVALRLNRS